MHSDPMKPSAFNLEVEAVSFYRMERAFGWQCLRIMDCATHIEIKLTTFGNWPMQRGSSTSRICSAA